MRHIFRPQLNLFATPIDEIEFDIWSRHELTPILVALQFLYKDEECTLRRILKLIENDMNLNAGKAPGRTGMVCWEILVLSSLRLGCNLDYDQLADLATNHRKIQQLLGYREHDRKRFARSTIHNNASLLKAETVEEISFALIDVAHEHCLNPLDKVRADSFVMKKNVHYPSDTNMVYDGVRKTIDISVKISGRFNLPGWRKHDYLRRRIKTLQMEISRVARSRRADREKELKRLYPELLESADGVVFKAEKTLAQMHLALKDQDPECREYWEGWGAQLHYFIAGTQYVEELARRRILEEETIPNPDKVFSLFEPDTELINRGKTPNPIEFGHRVLVVQDASGFILFSRMLDIGFTDEKIITEVMEGLQKRYNNHIKALSLDKGFWTPDNLVDLSEIIDLVVLPKKGKPSAEDKERQSDPKYKKVRKWRAGVESAIGALVFANRLGTCVDRGQDGYRRYLAMGVLGRNLHTFGRILVEKEKQKRKRENRTEAMAA